VAVAAALAFWRVPAMRKDIPPDPAPPAADFSLVFTDAGASCPDPSALPLARVLMTVDGDTLRVLWDGQPVFLRYYGVNTPERDQPCYDEATRRNAALAGEEVRLGFDGRSRDRFGRLLAYVFTPRGDSLDARLVAEGWGRAWRRDGRWQSDLGRLEDQARRARRGCLWAEGA
jgi:endonuclease YncB( thermonuclease family)